MLKGYADGKLTFACELHKADSIQSYVDWANIALMDVRGRSFTSHGVRVLRCFPLRSFRMSKIKGANTSYSDPESVERSINRVREIVEGVENLLGLVATTNAVENWIWDKVAGRFVFNEEKLKENNPYATGDILERLLLEANRRDYWKADEYRIGKI